MFHDLLLYFYDFIFAIERRGNADKNNSNSVVFLSKEKDFHSINIKCTSTYKKSIFSYCLYIQVYLFIFAEN
jgi:hypothetical protein